MPWYTTADARRDAEKQSASKNRENSVRDNEGPSMNDIEREYRQLCRIDETPGVQGLAQLGRNAIERVAQLEKELAAAVAERDRYHYQALTLDMLAARTLGDEPAEDAIMEKMDNLPDSKNPSGHLIACVIAERDKLRARLAAIDSAPTAASIGIDVLGKPRALYFPPPHRSAFAAKIDAVGGWTIKELIARPAKD